jgi:hypothetical protein
MNNVKCNIQLGFMSNLVDIGRYNHIYNHLYNYSKIYENTFTPTHYGRTAGKGTATNSLAAITIDLLTKI